MHSHGIVIKCRLLADLLVYVQQMHHDFELAHFQSLRQRLIIELDAAENVEKFVGYEKRRPQGAERCWIRFVGIHEREVGAFADYAMIPDSAIVVDNNSGKLSENKVADVVRQGIPRGHHFALLVDVAQSAATPLSSYRHR